VPELPDVEGFRRLLERHATGRRIRDVEVLDDTVVRNTNPATLRRGLAGRRLEPPKRRLWRAHLHPDRQAASLASAEWDRLHRALGSVLRTSVKEGHVPPRRSWLTGVRDEQHPACPRCHAKLRRTRRGGRSTLWCPACQPTPP
jgi:formamidopyrimidine-DNA glycosylase